MKSLTFKDAIRNEIIGYVFETEDVTNGLLLSIPITDNNGNHAQMDISENTAIELLNFLKDKYEKN